jgi:hypothetical protein
MSELFKRMSRIFQKVRNKKRKPSFCAMNWTSTLQQLVEIKEAYRVQKVYEDVPEDNENVSFNIGKNNDDDKYVKNLTVKKMLELMKELDILTQENTYL